MQWLERDLDDAVTVCLSRTPRPYFQIDHFINRVLQFGGARQGVASPVLVSWEVTEACNLRCRHCYQQSVADGRQLSRTDAEKLVHQLADLQVVQVTVSGGEPFLREDLMDILALLKRKRIAVTLQTNAVLLTQQQMDQLQAFFIPHVDLVQISLDGASASTHNEQRNADVFRLACNAVAQLSARGIDVVVSCCPTIKNEKEIPAIYRLADELCATAFQATPLAIFNEGHRRLTPDQETLFRAEAEVIRLSDRRDRPYYLGGISGEYLHWISLPASRTKQNKRRSADPFWACGAIREKLHIAADGRVYPCVFATGQPLTDRRAPKEPLAAVWSRRLEHPYHQGRRQQSMSCRNCDWNAGCKGGCPGMAEQYSGSTHRCDPRCGIGLGLEKEHETLV